MAKGTLSAEQFREWLTPMHALGRLSDLSSVGARYGWIARRLSDGLLKAAARTVVQPGYDDRRFLILAPSDWRKWTPDIDTDFWEAGDYAGLATSVTGYDTYLSAPFRAYDVRLDPSIFDELDKERREKSAAAVTRMLEALRPAIDMIEINLPVSPGGLNPALSPRSESSATILHKQVTPVTDGEVQAWYAAMSSTDQALGLLKLRAKAKAYFGPRPVLRKLLEPFVAGRKTGRPPRA